LRQTLISHSQIHCSFLGCRGLAGITLGSRDQLGQRILQAAQASGATAAPRQALPSGVRVVLTFAPGSGLNGTLTRDSLLGP